MIRKRAYWLSAAAALLVAGTIAACGGDDFSFPGDDDDDDDEATVTVTGNIDDVSPVSTRDIVVFVYAVDYDGQLGTCVGGADAGDTCSSDGDCESGDCNVGRELGVCVGGADGGDSCSEDSDCASGDCSEGRCPCPAFPTDTSNGKAAVIESGETEFSLSGIDNGALKLVFLLDNPGDDADGQIDPGDPIAVLDDEDCELDDVEGNQTVNLEDIDIEFASAVSTDCQDGTPPASGRARANLITQERTDDNGN